jgi:uncharacterized DUF497 family protein
MSQVRFEWDSRRAGSNEKKHGVSFEEARFILLGVSASIRLLVVVHALRERDVIRIISARKATRLETREYEIRLR